MSDSEHHRTQVLARPACVLSALGLLSAAGCAQAAGTATVQPTAATAKPW